MSKLKILQCFMLFFCTDEELFEVTNTWIYPVWI